MISPSDPSRPSIPTPILRTLSLHLLWIPATIYFVLSGLIQPFLARLLYYLGLTRLGVARSGSPRGVLSAIVMSRLDRVFTPRGEPVARSWDAIPLLTSLEGLDILLYFGQQALAGLDGGPGTVGGDEEVIQFMRCPYERVIL